MSAKANTTKIGVFVILAVIFLILGLLAFGAKTYFTPKIKVETAIPGDVSGLSVGSGVNLRGVPIGKVTQITFAWNKYPETPTNLIIVEFEVESPLLPLPPGMNFNSGVKQASERGLRAIVKGQGITGTSILALEFLDPKDHPPQVLNYTPRHPYIPSAPGQLTRLVDSLGESLDHLKDLDFASIGRGVTNTLDTTRELIAKLGNLDFGTLSTNANALLADLKTTVESVQKTLQEAKVDTIVTNANGLLTEVRASNEKLQTVLDNLGNAPVQKTIAELQQTMATLNDVLSQLKEYPSGFIFGKPPRPIEGVQRQRAGP